MKKTILLALLLLLPSSAYAQKTKAALTTEVNTNFASGSSITASTLRTTVLDIINSYYDLNGTSTLSCAASRWVSSLPTLSSITCTQPGVADLTGFGTGVATALGINVGSAGAFVTFNGALGTPLSGTGTNLTGLPISTGVSGLGTGVATALGTNVGLAGAFVTFNGALGTPSSGTGTNLTGTASGLTAGALTASSLTSAMMANMNAYTFKGNATGAGATPTDVSIPGLTLKASPVSSDLVMIADSAASNAWKQTTVGAIASAGSVASVNTQTGAVTLLTEAQGRLTLTANTPVMIATASAQTTLRYDCYVGNQVPYYTGAADAIDTITSCEVTDAMVSAASAGQVVSANVYDAWWVHGGANRICLAMSASTGGGGGWASDTAGSNTARGTGYSQLDRTTRPYATNKNAITNCFNGATNYGSVSANQATYLGTVYASANGQVSWTLGAASSGGTAALLGVWNMYNRVQVNTYVGDTATPWTYAGTTPRSADNSTGNRVQIVRGIEEDGVEVRYVVQAATGTLGANAQAGIGLDSTTSTANIGGHQSQVSVSIPVVYSGYPGVGFHFFQAQDQSVNAATITYQNDSANTQMRLSYIGRH